MAMPPPLTDPTRHRHGHYNMPIGNDFGHQPRNDNRNEMPSMRHHQHVGGEGSFRGDAQHFRPSCGDVQRGTAASADSKQTQRQFVEIGPRINMINHRAEVQDFVLRQPVQRFVAGH